MSLGQDNEWSFALRMCVLAVVKRDDGLMQGIVVTFHQERPLASYHELSQ